MAHCHAGSVHPNVQWARSDLMFSSVMHFRHCSTSIRGLYTVCARITFPTPSCCHHLPVLLLPRQMVPMTSHSIRGDRHPKETWIHPTKHSFFTPSAVQVWCFCSHCRRTLLFCLLFGCCSPFVARESSKSCLLRWHSVQQCWIWTGSAGWWLCLNNSQHSPLTPLIRKRFSFYIHLILFLTIRSGEPAIAPNTLFMPRTTVTWRMTRNAMECANCVKEWYGSSSNIVRNSSILLWIIC